MLTKVSENEKIISYHSSKAYNYFKLSSKNKNIASLKKIINSTLIIVPRGPVYVKWERTLKESTNLKYLAVENLNFINKKEGNWIVELNTQVAQIKNAALDIV